MSTLTISNIEKSYANGYQAIHKLNLVINDGEMVVLVGPSGCGKSTLLRMIAGLEEITSGEIKIDGRIVNDLEPSERDIAMVFQNYALYPHMTVYNNMAYGLRNRKIPKAEIKRIVHETAKMLEIEHLLESKPKRLSGGQRQRVAMGRAIVREPKIFLFDEPLSNLDAKLRVQMRLQIKKLQRRLAVTSVYVTHDQIEAMTLADKLVVLNEGMVEQIGTPLEIYNDPASLFVATFIGSPAMNILNFQVTPQGLKLGCSLLPFNTQSLALGDVKLGLRPEHIQITTDTPWFEVKVEFIESLGADLLLYCHTIDVSMQDLVIRVQGDSTIKINDILGLDVNVEHLHLFDIKTLKRINIDIKSPGVLEVIYA
ncbi:ABC transporter ATP-binding protein [Psychromonas sp. CNPT3]|uniref:sn-glycerol-3-phosphate import ATP-binding protein UgpC n=1 Tax=Psychromonas sp. CNPT3 TaxID=314282 RepID=UPI00006E707E|nr:sn-glycerol-3-phosphate import ATP-binding protein UgpC [Psychromonas sp. CNPT3]AGH80037.1 ABC transporter ATP-binding protein [Psychromonas sp. CNPT3]